MNLVISLNGFERRVELTTDGSGSFLHTFDLKLVFTHPFEAGHTMDMGKPEQFFMVRKKKKNDLLATLKPITWTGLTNSGAAYETSVKLRGMGDNVFCLVPSPYLEKEENCYIQQITKKTRGYLHRRF